jgi:gluconolactonase
VVKSDGSIWFTDPVFGLLGNYEGYKAASEIDANVYRVDGATGKASIVARAMWISPLQNWNLLCCPAVTWFA